MVGDSNILIKQKNYSEKLASTILELNKQVKHKEDNINFLQDNLTHKIVFLLVIFKIVYYPFNKIHKKYYYQQI